MKTTKTIFMAAMLIGSSISLSARADGEDRSPYIAPACNVTIVQPDNAAGFYWSKDCKTIYVLPPLTGTVQVTSFENQSANLQACPDLNQAYKTKRQYADLQRAYLKKIQSLPPGDPQVDSLQRQINEYRESEKDLLTEYENMYGGSASLLYKVGQSQDWVNQYFLKNMNTVIEHQINIQPTPIKESYISFFAKNSDTDMGSMSPVIKAGIPGVTPPDQRGKTITTSSVAMNGAIQAELILSMIGACPSKTDPNWQDAKLTAYLASNLTYTVPLKSWAGYTASLKSSTAIQNMVKSWQNKSQFNVTEATTMASTGVAGTAFEFQVDGNEVNAGAFSADAQRDFFKQIADESRERLTLRLLEQMTIAGFLEMAAPAPMAQAPQPGYIDEIRNGQSCSSSSIFGFNISGGCSNFQYTVKVPYNTSADTFLTKINDVSFTNTETVRVADIIYRVHTSTFIAPQAHPGGI